MPDRPRATYATKAAIARAVAAWRALGREPDAIELAPDGTIRLIARRPEEGDEWQRMAARAGQGA